MLFLNDKLDVKGQATGSFFLNEVLINQPKPGSKLSPITHSFQQDIDRGDAKNPLVNTELLNKKLGTEDSIVRFLNQLHERKSRLPIVPRGYKNPKLIYHPQAYGIGN